MPPHPPLTTEKLQSSPLDLHRFDNKTALHETLRALDDLVSSGKVLYLGASNFAAWQIARALGISELHGWAKFVAIQPMYNLVKRQAEVEILPMAKAEQLGVFPYSPLGGGLLTGKYGVHPVSLAIAWVSAHPAVCAPIIGARNTEQLTPALDSVDVDITNELYDALAALAPTPPPATDRNEERSEHNYGSR